MPFVTACPNAMAPRVAVVTGGSTVIGRQAALRLAEEGLDIVVAYTGSRPVAEEVRTAIEERAGRALAVKADVADEADVLRLFQHAEEVFGAVDVVVNASEVVVRGPVSGLAPEEFDRMHRTNVLGTFLVGHHAARRLRPGGTLINLSSSLTLQAVPDHAAYASYTAGKAAVNALTTTLARELRKQDVTVNAIAPDPDVAELAALDGRPDLADIADAVAFLAGPGHWLNGQILYVGSRRDYAVGS